VSRARIAINVFSWDTVDCIGHQLACIILEILGLGDVTIFGDFWPFGARHHGII